MIRYAKVAAYTLDWVTFPYKTHATPEEANLAMSSAPGAKGVIIEVDDATKKIIGVYGGTFTQPVTD